MTGEGFMTRIRPEDEKPELDVPDSARWIRHTAFTDLTVQTSLYAHKGQMLAIRRYLTVRQSRETRGDYDALPLSDLGSGQSVSTPTNPRRYDQTPLTLRRGIITIISTIVAFTGVVFVFSLLVDDANLHSPATDIPSNYLLRIEANGGFYRDAYPIRSMLKYWNIAEKEVKERGLDTCNGQLGRELIDAHLRTTIDYCHSPVSAIAVPNDN